MGLLLAPAPSPSEARPILPPAEPPASTVSLLSSLAPGGGPPDAAWLPPADALTPEVPAPAPVPAAADVNEVHIFVL